MISLFVALAQSDWPVAVATYSVSGSEIVVREAKMVHRKEALQVTGPWRERRLALGSKPPFKFKGAEASQDGRWVVLSWQEPPHNSVRVVVDRHRWRVAVRIDGITGGVRVLPRSRRLAITSLEEGPPVMVDLDTGAHQEVPGFDAAMEDPDTGAVALLWREAGCHRSRWLPGRDGRAEPSEWAREGLEWLLRRASPANDVSLEEAYLVCPGEPRWVALGLRQVARARFGAAVLNEHGYGGQLFTEQGDGSGTTLERISPDGTVWLRGTYRAVIGLGALSHDRSGNEFLYRWDTRQDGAQGRQIIGVPYHSAFHLIFRDQPRLGSSTKEEKGTQPSRLKPERSPDGLFPTWPFGQLN